MSHFVDPSDTDIPEKTSPVRGGGTALEHSISEYGKVVEPVANVTAVYILQPEALPPPSPLSSDPSSALEPSPATANVQQSIALSNEFGKNTSCEDLRQVLTNIGYRHVEILPITLANYRSLLAHLQHRHATTTTDTTDSTATAETFVVFNLCDGCETDGYPGISVVRELERLGIAYTGADAHFYDITTSKPTLKRQLQQHHVPTSSFVELNQGTTEAQLDALQPYPLIVKPSISYASISITDKSIVFNAKEALLQARQVRGVDQGVFAERFLAGREFTVLLTGDVQQGVHVYMPAERVFNSQLQTYQRILAFDRYWDGYDLQGNTPGKDAPVIYWYAPAPADLQETLRNLAKRAYLALHGNGYGRVDIRTDGLESRQAFVLEVNSNCGLSYNPEEFTTTAGEILRMSGERVERFVNEMLRYAVQRKRPFAE